MTADSYEENVENAPLVELEEFEPDEAAVSVARNSGDCWQLCQAARHCTSCVG